MKAHKYKELIKAWADGAVIESRDRWTVNADWRVTTNPSWSDTIYEYRIKPAPKPNFYKLYLVFTNRIYSEGERFPISGFNKPNLKLCFDGETGELKSAEVLK